MALRAFSNLAYDDEELYDRSKGMPAGYEPPSYPPGCCFTLKAEDLEKAGGSFAAEPGTTMRFSAMGEVSSVMRGRENCRIELELCEFAGEDGKLFDLSMPTHICLCDEELEKMDLDADCERGDTIHLIGTARLESTSDTEYGGKMVSMQIVELTYEDESEEARTGEEK